MTNKYTASIDGVIIGKRTSKTREYTHCIAVKWSRHYALDAAVHPAHVAQDVKNWEYWMASEENRRYTRSEYIERALKCKTGEEYAKVEADRRIAAINADVDRWVNWHVITWCGRPDLAQKEFSKWCGRYDAAQVRIVDAVKA